MTKRHDDIFDAVLSGVPKLRPLKDDKDKAGARFLKRGNAISDRLAGDKEDKTLLWVDPACCKMWDQHNRDYELLTEENCRDLIEGIRSQGRQEFPAIVRKIDDAAYEYEVICGARRHFAVNWLRQNNYSQFKYLVEVRDLTDEEAFRLADIENRDREDISDYERAVDYARAITLYYGGKQKAMAERLEVSEVWLSRYLELSRLPDEIVAAFPSILEIRELHARTLKPLLKAPETRADVLKAAQEIAAEQAKARAGQGAYVDAQKVVARLKAAGTPNKRQTAKVKEFRGNPKAPPIYVKRKGTKHQIEFSNDMSRSDLEAAFAKFIAAEF